MSNQNIVNVECSKFIEDNYSIYGKFVNLNRVVPYIDGLKPSHRRLLLALGKNAQGKLIATSSALGLTQHLYHPFGDSSIEDVIAELARKNVIDSQGDFGIKLMDDLKHAAPRYTKVGLTTEQYRYFFRLLKYAPTTEGEIAIEPEFLITPVPMCLVTGNLSWGIGMISRSPAFTYKSLIEAYENDDPSLLVPSYGYKLDRSNSQLSSLWEKGSGRLCLKYNVERLGRDVIRVTGSGEMFKPKFGKLDRLLELAQIKIDDSSSDQIDLIIRRLKGARSVNMDEVYETVVKCCTLNRSYNVQVVHEGRVRSIGIRDWLHVTMKLFKDAFEQNKTDSIKRIQKQIQVLEILPQVAELCRKDYEPEQIAKELKVPIDIVMAAGKRNIFSIRKKEFTAEIAKLTDTIKKIEKEDSNEEITNFAGYMNGIGLV